mmetsp:Transcript_37929/g.52607  ORF Transcript_37929/g.52607 Transcript_37929/m.52607 type:complete len:87 (+) Transcript_37929:865-1125(+)
MGVIQPRKLVSHPRKSESESSSNTSPFDSKLSFSLVSISESGLSFLSLNSPSNLESSSSNSISELDSSSLPTAEVIAFVLLNWKRR